MGKGLSMLTRFLGLMKQQQQKQQQRRESENDDDSLFNLQGM